MDLLRITLATDPSDILDEAEYRLTDVRECEEEWGSEVLKGETRTPHLKFLYATR